ncbi:hypothetical protein ACQW02_04640 [Humitalea sp. 24SJ18S-53]|uniref:hypothetical protein n=1 Tax=Humitalea sp. 24SJ18S-53 TaxID=3422307 RepID=UPI003D664E98
MAITVTSAHFKTMTGIKTERNWATGFRKSSGSLNAIYDDLIALEGPEYTKVAAQDRWLLMLSLAGKCRVYLDKKERKGKDLTEPKYIIIDRLEASLLAQAAKERGKSDALGQRLRNNQNHAGGAVMGRNNPGHGKVVFELALTGALPNGKVVNGQTLWTKATQAGVQLTGDEARDAFILRAWLKQMARSGQLAALSLDPLDYMDETRRINAELTFTSTLVRQRGAPFNTYGGYIEGEDKAGMLVIAEDGTWYGKEGPFIGSTFHHSTFMSGAPVLLAGTIRCNQGKLLYISNNSGHYAPDLAALLNGTKNLQGCGLDQAARHDVSIAFADHQHFFAPRMATYLFPYRLFMNRRGNVPNPANYVVTTSFDEYFWANPGAARPNHHAGVGAKGIVTWP